MTAKKAPGNGLKFIAGQHRYTLDGKWVPGVTTIVGILDKPTLVTWAANLVAEFVADRPDDVEILRNMGRDTLVTSLKKLPDEHKKSKGTRGTNIHDNLQTLLETGECDVPDEYVPVVEHAMQFLEDWAIDPIVTEVPVGSRKHQYAGKPDLIASYANPQTGATGTAIFDWKSGKAMYPEYAWQLSAYAFAEFCGEGGNERPLPSCDAAFGVHIRADGYDVYPLKFGPDVFQEFLALRELYPIVKKAKGDWKIPGSGHVGVAIHKGEAA